MRPFWQTTLRLMSVSALAVGAIGGTGSASAVEIGQEAPDFSLTATTGGKISLSQFRGKQPVLIEFYGADYSPA